MAVYEQLDDEEKAAFGKASTPPTTRRARSSRRSTTRSRSGNEIRSVIQATRRHGTYPMGKIDGTDMWKVGEKVRANARAQLCADQPVHGRRLRRQR